MTATINGIPLFSAVITDCETGMFAISLVDRPAVESDFLAFDDTKRIPLYCVANEEQRLVRGVVMRADFPIYRYSEEMGEYYIVFSKETIRSMAEKYLADYCQNNVTLHHITGAYAEGIHMVQYFIKDSAWGVTPYDFPTIEDGSLFAEFKVHDDNLWAQIKEGTFKGFSLEGVFSLRKVETETNQPSNNMSKMQKFKEALAKLVGECFAQVTTDKGVLRWETDEDLKAGDSVFYINEQGEAVKPEDGDYRTEDGKVIRVADGKVVEIVDDNAEVDEEGEKEEQKAELLPIEEERIARIEEAVARIEEVYAAIEERVARIEERIADEKEAEQMSAISKEVAELREALKVAPKGIAEKFEESSKEADSYISNLAKMREEALK